MTSNHKWAYKHWIKDGCCLGHPTTWVKERKCPSPFLIKAKGNSSVRVTIHILLPLLSFLLPFRLHVLPSSLPWSWRWSCLPLLLPFVLLLLLFFVFFLLLSVVASSFFFSFEVSYPSSSSFFLLWWWPLWMFVCGCYCLFSLLIVFFFMFTTFVIFFIAVFFVCMWFVMRKYTYRFVIRMSHTDKRNPYRQYRLPTFF